ncbi:uncharacterized protein LOC115972955 [Quercus lobata]|uniref:uncharacterized protein LOC115972955 n=1 Tax=Quercus lobata TaxID=97700 RepID=UPI001243FCE5|nr:uncharacterized protein LOC115972955 [Quercus lobata]
MAVHSKNKALICKVFPSSLGPVVMRWFDRLDEGSISSFQELTRAFRAQFVTCSKVPCPLDSLLFMVMREGETLKTYSDRYLEMFNEIDGDFEDVVIRTFKVVLPIKHDLRKSLTKKPVRSMRQLIDRIDKHKQVVNIVFKEPVLQILEKINVEPYFKWTNKMEGGPMKRNQGLYCQYHQDREHTIEDYRTLRDYLEQLVKIGKLRQILHQPFGQGNQAGSAH